MNLSKLCENAIIRYIKVIFEICHYNIIITSLPRQDNTKETQIYDKIIGQLPIIITIPYKLFELVVISSFEEQDLTTKIVQQKEQNKT